MKLSSQTLDILRNFVGINQDILIKPGNVINTISQQGNLYAEATVSEDFPVEFGVYKLKRFLDALNLINDPDLDFGTSKVDMKGDKNSISFTYADPSIITAPQQRLNIPAADLSFDVAADDLSRVLKASVALELPDVSIKVADDKLSLVAHDKESDSCDVFTVDLGEVDSPDMRIDFKSDNFKMLPMDFTVNVIASGKKKAAQFVGENISYLVAGELSSTYEG